MQKILTVSYLIERNVTSPFIRIRGRWLASAGFKPKDRIEVQNPEPGVLVIKKIEKERSDDDAVYH